MTYVQPRTTWMRTGQGLGSGKEPIAPYASGVTRRASKDRRAGRWRRRPRICGEVPGGVGKRGNIFSPEDKPRGARCPDAVQEWMETERAGEKRGAAGDRPQHGTLYCARRAGGRGGRRGGGEVWRTGESSSEAACPGRRLLGMGVRHPDADGPESNPSPMCIAFQSPIRLDPRVPVRCRSS